MKSSTHDISLQIELLPLKVATLDPSNNAKSFVYKQMPSNKFAIGKKIYQAFFYEG